MWGDRARGQRCHHHSAPRVYVDQTPCSALLNSGWSRTIVSARLCCAWSKRSVEITTINGETLAFYGVGQWGFFLTLVNLLKSMCWWRRKTYWASTYWSDMMLSKQWAVISSHDTGSPGICRTSRRCARLQSRVRLTPEDLDCLVEMDGRWGANQAMEQCHRVLRTREHLDRIQTEAWR